MHKFINAFIILGCIFFFTIALAATYLEIGLPWKHGEKREIMTAYLEEKYKDSFTLEKIRFDFMHGKNYYSYATAASTNVNFYVEVTPDDNVTDAYGYEYWNSEIATIFEPILEPIIGPVYDIKGIVFTPEGTTPHSFELENTTFFLEVLMGVDLPQDDLANEVNNWYTAIETLREENYSMDEIRIQYNDYFIALVRETLRDIQSSDQLMKYFNENKNS